MGVRFGILGPICAAVLTAVSVTCGQAVAQTTLDLAFRPPLSHPGRICGPQRTDAERLAQWQGWSGRVLPDRPLPEIRNDVVRLLALDPEAWGATADRAVALLAERPEVSPESALLLRIQVLDRSGAFDVLNEQALVPKLAELEATLSPRGKLTLSRYLRDGLGIARDVARADALLVAAGFSGDDQALMQLAEMQLAGQAPADWGVPLEVTVTTALTALVGDLDAGICDRTLRIARHYEYSPVLTPNPELANAWFRFTADMGSGHAAWKLAEAHLLGSGGVKSNEQLLTYMTVAAEAGLIHAQIELARIYEVGALVAQDWARARDLLEQAAATGTIRGLSQLARFLERLEAHDPSVRADRKAVLAQMIAHAETPAWVFTRMAQMTLEDLGRWAGRDAARDWLEEALLLDDLDAAYELGRLLLWDDPSPQEFDRAVSLLDRVATRRGGSPAMTQLHAAFACRATDGPHVNEAGYWQARKDALDTTSERTDVSVLEALTSETHPLIYAELQTQGLAASPSGLSEWLHVVAAGAETVPAQADLWSGYHEETDAVAVARAIVALAAAQTPAEEQAVFERLRARYRAVGPRFAAHLAASVLDRMYGPAAQPDLTPDARQEGIALMRASAALGYGRPMQVLVDLAATEAEAEAVFKTYRAAIDRDGDFAAMLFASRHAEDAAPYLARAAGSMTCTYRSAVEMVDLGVALDDTALRDHWLTVAETLLGDKPKEWTHLAGLHLELLGDAALPKAMDLLARASLRGDPGADAALFRLVISPDAPVHDPQRAAAMMARALQAERFDVLAGYLAGYRQADAATQAVIAAQLDLGQAYRLAAESGDAVAMRVHGLALRDKAGAVSDVAKAMVWLHRAAEAGDATAMVEYGQALAFGIGVPADHRAATDWLQRAAAEGNDKARDLARLIAVAQSGAGQ